MSSRRELDYARLEQQRRRAQEADERAAQQRRLAEEQERRRAEEKQRKEKERRRADKEHKTMPTASALPYRPSSNALTFLPSASQSETLIAEFVKLQYDQNEFELLARLVVDKFKELPPRDPPIKCQSSFRAKDPKSLSEKLQKQSNSQPFENMDQIYGSERLWDLAGVRILAYFPDDVPAIAKQIASLFKVLGKPIVVHSKRTQNEPEQPNRAETVASDKAHAQFDKYQKGSWSTKKNLDSIGTEWKHAGYRAIHFHVEVDGNQTPSNLMPWQKRVEVQVSTVVMHAWSEVEHDIIYKNPFELPKDPTMDRMVDAINGLAITSEILLQELQQTTLNVRNRDAQVLSQDALEDWIYELYLDIPIPLDGAVDAKDDDRAKASGYIDFVLELLWSPFFPIRRTRKQVRRLIPKREMESQNPSFLLRELLKNRHPNIADLTNEVYLTPSLGCPPAEIPGQQLYKLLLASSAYSIAVYLDPEGEWWRMCSLSKQNEMWEQINKILTGRLPYSHIPRRTLNQLEVYAESFLNCSCGDKHEVANQLAKLSWFITSAPDLEIDSPPITPTDFGFLAKTVGSHDPPGRRVREEMKEDIFTRRRRLPPSLAQIIKEGEEEEEEGEEKEKHNWWYFYVHQQDLKDELPFMWFHPIDIRHYVDCVWKDVKIHLLGTNDDTDDSEGEHDPNDTSPEASEDSE